jgi:CheY-like chemotaxis protein
MKALGGSFEINSTPGQGTIATLSLPLAARDEREMHDKRDEQKVISGPVAPFSPVSQVSQHARIRVLLVDDHAMVRQGLRSLLESYADIEVVGEACDGYEAIALADKLNPNVVVMDINMPNMNGVEATAQIVSRRPDTVVIGLSVNAGGDNVQVMKKAGAALLITKEAAVEELYQAIQDVLGAHVANGEERSL